MYGFISIENTVKIFGAGAALAVGEGGGEPGRFVVTFVTGGSCRLALGAAAFSQL